MNEHPNLPIAKQNGTNKPLQKDEFVSNNNPPLETKTDEKSNGYHNINPNTQLTISKLSFNLTDINTKYIKKTETIYISQCSSLKYENSKQLALWQLLSIQRKNHNYPLMLYLIDCFLRDRLEYFIHQNQILNLPEWCIKYKRIKQLLNNEKKKSTLENIIISGMKTYVNRSCIPMILPTFHKIDDSIERFTQCIQEASNLIVAIKKNPLEILPFQIDLLIIPSDIIDINNNESPLGSGNEEFDFDSDNESSEEDTFDISEQKSESKNEINNVNIKSRLKNNNIKYAYNNAPIATMKREFVKLYKSYLQINDDNKISNGQNLNNKRLNDLDNLGIDLQRMPHRRRICIVVDRRLNESKDNNKIVEKNEIYLYEPNVFNEIPSKHMKEWYMESTNQCVLPGDKCHQNNENIKANTSMNGWINIFSFHIETEEDIKCYLYRDGQMIRFMAHDIVQLLPYLFETKNFKNAAFIDAERKNKNYIKKLKNIWKDLNFDLFQKHLS